ncbi:M48 family metalloprotease [Sphingomonas sp.]|jgi:predicted Zn-dependent protease|uniref:M48 family metalloprotease n=1 Tax=Sphingomonas sp. TaxID=28214 RepID=UPI002DE2AB09|nr:M48 family metalloprotease [Sphingomonas sp.]HEV2569350.1 M48 family metalloprotease [Sphingomonas sp.]
MRRLTTAFVGICGATALVAGTIGHAQPRAISQNERAQGDQVHPQLLRQYGGAYGGPQAAYVSRVGKRIAVQSGLSNSERDFQVTLLNSPVNNAFAIPGGYVYVTRQLLALMNDEAELAAVLGHEIGHVAARHSRSRSRTSTGTSLLATLLGAVTGSSAVGQLAGQVGQLYTLRFSRKQEIQSDDLGVSYLSGAGYDPLAMSSVLASLADQNRLDQSSSGPGGSAPEWASTHPDPASRVLRARQRAQQVGRMGGERNRDAFLAAIDGMIYGDDPRQGVIDGRSFRHPDLRIAFTAPLGYTLSNSPDAVLITGRGGQAQLSTLPFRGDLADYVDRAFTALSQSGRAPAPAVQRTRVNGMEAAYATTRASTGRQAVDATVFAIATSRDNAYHFLLVTPAGQGIGPFGPLIDSFRALSPGEASQVRTRVIDVRTVRPGDTPERLAQDMAYEDLKLQRFLVLNGFSGNAALRAGEKVKLVVWRR